MTSILLKGVHLFVQVIFPCVDCPSHSEKKYFVVCSLKSEGTLCKRFYNV